MTEQEEFDRAEQEIKGQIEAICKAHNLSAQQCQDIQEKLGIGHVFDWERAREIRDGLNSDNPSMRLRAVKAILDLTRILDNARPAWQSNHKRVESNRGLVVGLGILILAALT